MQSRARPRSLRRRYPITTKDVLQILSSVRKKFDKSRVVDRVESESDVLSEEETSVYRPYISVVLLLLHQIRQLNPPKKCYSEGDAGKCPFLLGLWPYNVCKCLKADKAWRIMR